MKNIRKHLIMASLLIAASACTNDNNVLVDTESTGADTRQVAIELTSFANRSTKAAATVGDLEFFHNTFKVYGTKTSHGGTKIQTVFDGVEVAAQIAAGDEPNTWSYSPVRYWDKQADNYKFVAFAPATAPLTYTHGDKEVGDATATFSSTSNLVIKGQNLQEGAPQTKEKHTGFTGETGKDCDVMRAELFPVAAPKTTPEVNLTFHHTLAKLNLTVKANSDAPYAITINSINVNDLFSAGKYDHNKGWVVANDMDYVDYRFTTPATKLSASEKTYFIESLVIPQYINDSHVVTINYTITSGSYSEEFAYTSTLKELFEGKADQFKETCSYTVNFNIAPESNIITFNAGVVAWKDIAEDKAVL